MTSRISLNGKGHRLLQHLSEGPATFPQIARAFGLASKTQRGNYEWRLERLCRRRAVSWVEGVPGEYEPYSSDWWEYGDVEFSLTRRGEAALEALGHDWSPRISVRVFGRAA